MATRVIKGSVHNVDRRGGQKIWEATNTFERTLFDLRGREPRCEDHEAPALPIIEAYLRTSLLPWLCRHRLTENWDPWPTRLPPEWLDSPSGE